LPILLDANLSPKRIGAPLATRGHDVVIQRAESRISRKADHVVAAGGERGADALG